jgi:Zn-finger nucleic acid-binding protein
MSWLSCPVCAERMVSLSKQGWTCKACKGLWVPTPLNPLTAQVPADFEVVGASRRLSCPSCQKPLSTLLRRGLELDRCPGCMGLWLDLGELEDLEDQVARSQKGPALGPNGEPLTRREELRERLDRWREGAHDLADDLEEFLEYVFE